MFVPLCDPLSCVCYDERNVISSYLFEVSPPKPEKNNSIARINVGNKHFCKPWICCNVCVYGLVRIRHTNKHLVRVRKTSRFGLKYLVLSHGSKVSRRLIKNTQLFGLVPDS